MSVCGSVCVSVLEKISNKEREFISYTEFISKEQELMSRFRTPEKKEKKIDKDDILSSFVCLQVEVKVDPNLTAGKQTVTPCHHGG